MTQKQKTYHAKLIKTAQILKRDIFADDEIRKEYLLSRFGVSSFLDLTIGQLVFVIEYFRGKNSGVPDKRIEFDNGSSKYQIDAIEGLWRQVANDTSDNALREFIKKITKKYPLHIGNLTKKEAQKVILALMSMKRRVAK